MPDQILIELLLDDKGTIENTIDELARLGQVDKELADQAKIANKEFTAQMKSFQAGSSSVQDFKKSFADVAKIFNQFPNDFKKGWNEGIIQVLKQAGVSIDEFSKAVGDTMDNIANEEAISALTKEIKSLEAAMLAGSVAGATASDQYIEMGKRLDFLKTQVKDFSNELDSAVQDTGFKNLRAELTDIKTAMLTMKDAGKENTEEYKILQERAQQLAASIKSINAEINDAPKETAYRTVQAEVVALADALARARVNNEAFGEDFERMEDRLRTLKQALAETNAATGEAIDTSKIDLAVESTGGLVDIFEVAGETTELFGLRIKGLEGTLVNTQGALAAFTNLQKIYEALTVQSTLSTKAHALAQGLYAAVVGKSTGALKFFRIALAATGIGAIIILIGALIANWDKLKETIGGVSVEQKELIEGLEESVKNREEELDLLSAQDAQLKRQGVSQDEILKKKIKILQQTANDLQLQKVAQAEITRSQIEAAQRNRDILAGVLKFLTLPLQTLLDVFNFVARKLNLDIEIPNISETIAGTLFDPGAIGEEGDKAQAEIDKQLIAVNEKIANSQNERDDIARAAAEQRLKDVISNIEAQVAAVAKGTKEELELQKKLLAAKANLDLNGAKTAAERRLITANLHADLLKLEEDFENAKSKIRIDGLENELSNTERLTNEGLIAREDGDRKILELKKKIIDEQAKLDINNAKLTADEIMNIEDKRQQEKAQLQREFEKKLRTDQIQDEINRNNAILASQKSTIEERTELEISNINLAADLEIEAAKGNAAKIAEIIANREAAILEVKKNAIREAVDFQLEQERTANAAHVRGLNRVLDDDRASFKEKKAAQAELTQINNDDINKRLQGLREEKRQGLVIGEKAEKEYTQKYNELLDERARLTEEDVQAQIDLRQEQLNKTSEIIAEIGSAVTDVFNFLADMANQRDQNRIDMMKKSLSDAEEAGALTEKQSIARQKRIEAEERKASINAARRDKQLAIFNAIINTAAAVTKVLANPVLAAIVAAQGALQIALIAARPLPKFAKGKKAFERFEGWGRMSETGPEILERNRQLYYVPKETIAWIGANDKIYNPKETQKLLEQNNQYVNKEVMKSSYVREKSSAIDYKKMGKEIGRHIKNVTVMVNSDGTTTEQRDYFNSRYNFKK